MTEWTQYNVRLNRAQIDRIRALADELGVPVATIIRLAIEQYLGDR